MTALKTLTVALTVAAFAASTAQADTIGYWQFDDQTPTNTATTLASQTNSPDANGTAVANGGGGAVAPNHAYSRPDYVILDGVGGSVLNAYNDASLKFTNAALPGDLNQKTGGRVNVQDPGASTLLEPAGDFTIEGFVRIDRHVNFATLVGKERSGGTSFTIDTNSNGTLRARVDSTTVLPGNGGVGDGIFNQGFTTSYNLEDGEWHHFALTYTASTRTIQLFGNYNSVGGAQLADGGVIVWDDGNLIFGNEAGGRAIDGWLDEIRYSSSVLTPDQFLVAVAPTPAALPAGLALIGLTLARRRRR